VPLILLIGLFIAVPIAELYVIIRVGDAIGVLPTIAILAADSILGSMLLKSQGRAVWRRFNETMQAGRVPHREVIDGVLVIFGGAFLITPGFLTDIVGVLLLLPPTRAVFRRFVQARLVTRAAGAVSGGMPRRPRPPRPDDYDVEGTATDYDAPEARRLDP
jgi:UPF0716 protein FxsA